VQKLAASVVIATKNRRRELGNALRSALLQSVAPEVIVIDDGSSDGTSEFVRDTFPQVKVVRAEVSRGYIFQRNRGAEIARGEILFSIDDDAVFTTEHVVEQTLGEFDRAIVGAVAIPFIEPRKSVTEHQRAPSAELVWVTHDFIGTAHALRRDVFLSLGGYRQELIHQGEESDYCIRMLDAGYIVRAGNADPIHHFESPQRSYERMDFYGSRNSVMFAWQNVPMPYLPVHLAVTSWNCVTWTSQPKRFLRRAGAVMGAFGAMIRHSRIPVRTDTYRLFRELKTGGPVLLTAIEGRLARPRWHGAADGNAEMPSAG
jgi:glycosyltransferase involved in cell wall biosynthesis